MNVNPRPTRDFITYKKVGESRYFVYLAYPNYDTVYLGKAAKIYSDCNPYWEMVSWDESRIVGSDTRWWAAETMANIFLSSKKKGIDSDPSAVGVPPCGRGRPMSGLKIFLDGKEMDARGLREMAHAKSEVLIPPTCPEVNRLFKELPAAPTLGDLDTLRTRLKTEATVPLRQALVETCERELLLQERVRELEEAFTHRNQTPKVYLVRRKDTGEFFRGDKVRHSVVRRTAWTPHAERAKIYWQQDQVARFFEGAYHNPPDYEIVTFSLVEAP